MKQNQFEFKPFDKVVVRNSESNIWKADFFSHINNNKYCVPYHCISAFNVDAVEMVTEDIFEELEKTNKCEVSTMTMANGIFVLSDLVKFAKYQPEMNENVDVMKNAYTFINESYKYAMEIKRQEELQKEKQDEIGGQNV